VTRETTATTRVTLGTPAGGARWGSLANLRDGLRSALFRQTASGALGGRKFLAGAAFVVVGAAISLSRTRGAGALNTIWIEDASHFLNDALHESVVNTLTTQLNGYYNVIPRAFTAVAVLFPLSWVPAVMSIFAAMQYALFGLIAYIASGPHLESRWLRLLVAAPTCVIPLGYTQANNDLATVQFIALYGTFWLLLWIPGTLAGRVLSPVIILGVTLSSVLPLLLAPLALARLFVDRSKNTRFLVACYALGLAAQLSLQLRGLSNRPINRYTGPWWSLRNYVARTVPRAIFGEKALGGPGTNPAGLPAALDIANKTEHLALIGTAWLVVVAVIIIALARVTEPHWPLAVTAGFFSVFLFVGEIIDNLAIVQPRYVIAPALLLYTAIVALLRPRGVMRAAAADSAPDGASQPGRAVSRAVNSRAQDSPAVGGRAGGARRTWYPVAAFACLLAVACVLNFRVTNGRSESPAWTSVVAAARQSCQQPGMTSYVYSHAWWGVHIPCGRLAR
jgi:hypothetical protein